MRLKLMPYPAYKDSGMEWLGDVPEHWDIRRIKTLFHEKDERSNNRTGLLLSLTRAQGIIPQGEASSRLASAEDLSKYKVCRPGDLVMNRMQAWSGMFSLSSYEGLVSPDYSVFGTVGVAKVKYFEHLFKAPCFVDQFARRSKGIGSGFNRLYTPDFGAIHFIVPPLDEQAAIVKFLGYMDRRIRRYVGAKKKLIKLLEEQKQAIIHRAVTRGLDPDVRLKPSGVEWLGDVPEHWEVQKLKQLTRFRNGLAFKPSDWSADGVPIIRIQNLNGSNDFNYTTRTDLSQLLRIQPGDLLFSWSGNRGTSFGSFIWDREFDGYLNQHIFKLYGFSLDRQYFAYLLRAVTRHVEEQTHGIIGLVHVTKPQLGSVMVPIASPAEQVVIAKFIDDHIDSVNSTIYRTKQEITLLNEYRTRLIADVVTGKLDVREAAASLPDEQIESELLGEENAPMVDDEFEGSDDDLNAELEEVEA